jgi:hypothetical protein
MPPRRGRDRRAQAAGARAASPASQSPYGRSWPLGSRATRSRPARRAPPAGGGLRSRRPRRRGRRVQRGQRAEHDAVGVGRSEPDGAEAQVEASPRTRSRTQSRPGAARAPPAGRRAQRQLESLTADVGAPAAGQQPVGERRRPVALSGAWPASARRHSPHGTHTLGEPSRTTPWLLGSRSTSCSTETASTPRRSSVAVGCRTSDVPAGRAAGGAKRVKAGAAGSRAASPPPHRLPR